MGRGTRAPCGKIGLNAEIAGRERAERAAVLGGEWGQVDGLLGGETPAAPRPPPCVESAPQGWVEFTCPKHGGLVAGPVTSQ